MEFSSNFPNFIAESLSKLKETKAKQASVFYLTKLQNVDFKKIVLSLFQAYEKSFFWSDPLNEISFFSFSEFYFVKENGKNRFLYFDKKIKIYFDPVFSNFKDNETVPFAIPLYFVAAKFLPESNPNLWKSFDDLYIFSPKWTVIQYKDDVYALNRFFITSDSKEQDTIVKFNNVLNSFVEISKSNVELENPKFANVDIKNPKEKKKFAEKIKIALEKIEEKELEKIVISRSVEVPFQNEPKIGLYLFKLIEQYPECKIYGFRSGKSTFFGASPETLLRIHNGTLLIEALAGTAPRGKDFEEDLKFEKELLESEKNLREHEFVVEHIIEVLKNKNFDNIKIERNKIKKLSNLQHIQTIVTAPISNEIGIFEIIDKLHPTPAVAGKPQQEAINFIKKIEEHERGLYSGFIGRIDVNLNCDIVLGLRCGLIENKKLYAFAGNGIAQGSSPIEEAHENELKLQTIVNLIKNEN